MSKKKIINPIYDLPSGMHGNCTARGGGARNKIEHLDNRWSNFRGYHYYLNRSTTKGFRLCLKRK